MTPNHRRRPSGESAVAASATPPPMITAPASMIRRSPTRRISASTTVPTSPVTRLWDRVDRGGAGSAGLPRSSEIGRRNTGKLLDSPWARTTVTNAPARARHRGSLAALSQFPGVMAGEHALDRLGRGQQTSGFVTDRDGARLDSLSPHGGRRTPPHATGGPPSTGAGPSRASGPPGGGWGPRARRPTTDPPPSSSIPTAVGRSGRG